MNPINAKSIGTPRTPRSIVSYFSSGGTHYTANATNQSAVGAKAVTSGALSAGVLTTVLNLSGPGVLYIAAAESNDATSRTHRLKLTLDGVVVFDATTDAVTAAALGQCAVGNAVLAATYLCQIQDQPVTFQTSCLLEYASSVGETGKTILRYKYTL